jgi:hypothetical protein
MKRFVYLVATALIALLATSCEHKELCYSHPHVARVRVVFDWRYAPNADPVTMSAYFFPKDGGEPLRFDFSDREGGVIEIASGAYDIIGVNAETNITTEDGGPLSFESMELYAPESSSYTTGLGNYANLALGVDDASDQRSAEPLDNVWSDQSRNDKILDTDEEQVITLYPEDPLCNYTVTIEDGANLQADYGVVLMGLLTNMSGGFRPGPEELNEEMCTIPFELTANAEGTGAEGYFRTFGHEMSIESQHDLILLVHLGDGSIASYTCDSENVTTQVHTAPDQRNVHIIIRGLKLPEPLNDNGLFNVTVDDWGDFENIELFPRQ